MTKRRYFFYVVLSFLIITLLLMTKLRYSSANDLSRLFTIRSLVQDHSLVIYQQVEKNSPDTIYLPGRGWYSDKPPLLSIVGAGIFLILRSTGLFFDPVLSLNPNSYYYSITLLISGLPFLIFFFLWKKSLTTIVLTRRGFNFWLVIGAAGTLLLPFATVFSNHLITALLAFSCLYILIKGNLTNSSFLILGLLAGLIPAIDVPFGYLWLVILSLMLWPQVRKKYRYYLLGLAPGIILTCFLNWLASGSLLPMYITAKEYLSLPENSWRSDLAILPPLQIIINFGQALLGFKKGLFIYSPILVLGVWALIRNHRSLLNHYQRSILLSGSLIYILGVVAITSDLGGASYGLRWALPFVPIWLWAAAEYWPYLARKSKYIWAIIAIFSIGMSILGLLDPWQSGQNLTLWHFLTRI